MSKMFQCQFCLKKVEREFKTHYQIPESVKRDVVRTCQKQCDEMWNTGNHRKCHRWNDWEMSWEVQRFRKRVRGVKQQHGYRTLGLSESGVRRSVRKSKRFRASSGSQSEQNNAAERSPARMPPTNHHFELTNFL